jgi:hypothetical protein
VKIYRSDIPPMGAGWAAQPGSAADVRALFPDLPWLWLPEGDSYWRTVSREWTVTAELALVGRHPLATDAASVAAVIERASAAAAGALDALLPPATGDAHAGRR